VTIHHLFHHFFHASIIFSAWIFFTQYFLTLLSPCSSKNLRLLCSRCPVISVCAFSLCRFTFNSVDRSVPSPSDPSHFPASFWVAINKSLSHLCFMHSDHCTSCLDFILSLSVTKQSILYNSLSSWAVQTPWSLTGSCTLLSHTPTWHLLQCLQTCETILVCHSYGATVGWPVLVLRSVCSWLC
jgi:hypothetical protein